MNIPQNAEAVQTVFCTKWGDRYGPEYVNRLYRMISRNTNRPLRFVCLTDDPTGIEQGVDIRPMPEFDLPEEMRYLPWRRLFLFQETVSDLSGTVMSFDLDLLITGPIDELFDYMPDSKFLTIENWNQMGQGIGNISVFRFNIGELPEIWNGFRADPLGMRAKYGNSQTYISRTLGEFDYFPPEWCLSYKHSIIPRWPLNFFKPPELPANARVIAFTGKPDIDEAARGEWPVTRWYKRLYKFVRPAPWLLDHWR